MPLRSLSFSLLLSAIAAGTPHAAELAFAHYAPGAGSVVVQVGDRGSEVLAYKDYVDGAPYPAGAHVLRAVRADGTLLVQGTLALREDDRYVVILAGNGSAKAPWQWRLATDHNRVFVEGQWSLQAAGLAIREVAGEERLQPVAVGTECSGSVRQNGEVESFGDGTSVLGAPRVSGRLSVTQGDTECVHYLLDPVAPFGRVSEVPVGAREGDRLRRFSIGDGVHAPYEIVAVNQGKEAILPVMEPDYSIEGLWSIVGHPNTGLQVAVDPSAAPGERISAVYFGFEADGRATWRTIEKLRLVEYIGGNVEGTRAAVGFDRASLAVITPHSCREMSMVVMNEMGPPSGRVFEAPPRNTVRLQRLFPPGCPPPVKVTPEVTP